MKKPTQIAESFIQKQKKELHIANSIEIER